VTIFDITVQQIVNGLILGSFYTLVALGYSMVYGIIKLLNFAHGDVYMWVRLSVSRFSPSCREL